MKSPDCRLQNGRDRKMNTENHNLLEQKLRRRNCVRTSARVGKAKMLLINHWRLSVDKWQRQKLQGDPIIKGSHTFVKIRKRSPHAFGRGMGKGNIWNAPEHFVLLSKAGKTILAGSNLLGYYWSLSDLEEGSTQLQPTLAILCHLRGRDWEALVKFIIQQHGLTATPETNHRALDHLPPPTSPPHDQSLLTAASFNWYIISDVKGKKWQNILKVKKHTLRKLN